MFNPETVEFYWADRNGNPWYSVAAADYHQLLELYQAARDSHRIIEACRADLKKTLEERQ